MSITKTGVQNLSLRLRLLGVAVLAGWAIGTAGGWAWETREFSAVERDHFGEYTQAQALALVGLTRNIRGEPTPSAMYLGWLAKHYPAHAQLFAAKSRRIFLYPFPLVGVLGGLGLLFGLSHLMTKKGPSK